MFCCWVNAWGCFHHKLNTFIFRSNFWSANFSGCIWEGLDCLISFLCFLIDWENPRCCFFKFLSISWIVLFLGHFWTPRINKLFRNLPGASQKTWVVQFLSTFLIYVKSLQEKFSWSFALILFDSSENISQK